MAKNSDLYSARTARKDEFYTQLTDIEKELRHYRQHFKEKTIFCNCDDPFESNFFKYFVLNFNRLGLKKLIATCYTGSPIANQELPIFAFANGIEEGENKPYKAIVTTVYDKTGDGGVDMLDVAELFKSGENELSELKGNGDFRSDECLTLLDEADIVVTNPPFSLFREYVATLMEHNKHFIIIGNVNAITYKEFFPLLMKNKVWIGATIHSGDRAFYVPDDYPLDASSCGIDAQTGRKYIRVKGVRWFTNLDIRQRHEEVILVKRFSPQDYPKYDNYDAINVDKTSDIPCDYGEVMGVPITFMDKYNPDQFEILGMDGQECSPPIKTYHNKSKVVNGQYMKSNTGTMGCVIRTETFGKGTYFDVGYPVRACYKRIFVRNKHPETPKEN